MYLLYWVGHQKRSSWSMFYDFLSFLYENFLTLKLYYTCGLSQTCTYRTLLFYFAAWNTWIPKQTIFSDHFKMSTHITILNFINYRGALCCMYNVHTKMCTFAKGWKYDDSYCMMFLFHLNSLIVKICFFLLKSRSMWPRTLVLSANPLILS